MNVNQPSLRFDGFGNEWNQYLFDDVAGTVPSKPFQIPSSEYKTTGLFPVVDQGKGLIAGYSDRTERVLHNTPVVVFGDHTTEIKLVDFPFVVGADGTKIITSKGPDTTFLYYSMLADPVKPTGYNRHFSILKKRIFNVPCLDEQKRIAAFLSLIERKISYLRRKKDVLTQFKDGVAQQLFSQKLRFTAPDGSTFPEWEGTTLGDLMEEYSNRDNSTGHEPASVGKYGIRPRSEVYSKDLSTNLSANKVIGKDTLTIGMGSKNIDIGILVENVTYCVSPAYSTFLIKTNVVHSRFLHYVMQVINAEISSLYMITGARQGKSVDKAQLLAHQVNIPSLEEQKRIVDALDTLEKKIQMVNQQLALMEQFKKGLLQQMFV